MKWERNSCLCGCKEHFSAGYFPAETAQDRANSDWNKMIRKEREGK